MAAKNQKLQFILHDLGNSDVQKQMTAVSELKVHGDESAIFPLLNALLSTADNELRRLITETLNCVKHPAAPKVIVSALSVSEFRPIRQTILASMWNSGADYRLYITDIVRTATEGDLAEVLECITIIENLEGPLDEELLLDAKLMIKEYLSLNKTESSQRIDLLGELDTLLLLKIDNS